MSITVKVIPETYVTDDVGLASENYADSKQRRRTWSNLSLGSALTENSMSLPMDEPTWTMQMQTEGKTPCADAVGGNKYA